MADLPRRHDEAPGTVPQSTRRRLAAATLPLQHTLKSTICCAGVGLHSGRTARLTLHPAWHDTGIVFVRTDLAGSPTAAARYDRVVDTTLSTMIGAGDARIGTIEHLMAAFAGAGIDNARAEIDGPELPILDGSAEQFLFLIDCAGRAEQPHPRRFIEILRPVRVEQDHSWAELRPHDAAAASPWAMPRLDLSMSIDFAAHAIGRQSHALRLTPQTFRHELSAARTFTQAGEIARLHAEGLALGGSLDNALVVDGDRILNPGGLRMQGECVRHKLLDAVGDLALAGHPLHGRFAAHRGGHTLSSRLLHALFADPAAWRLSVPAEQSWLSAA